MMALIDSQEKAAAPRLPGRSETATRFVGGLHVTAAQMFGRRARNNCASWFAGANVQYAHTARTAIQRALSLLNLRAGDEVLVPAYHCGSELDVILQAQAEARLFRVSRAGEIDVEDLEKRITRRTRAVYVIHYFGFPQPLTPVVELCRSKGLCLIEDCALSSLSEVEGRRIGSSGEAAIYNFPKVLPVPDGGALVMKSPELQRESWFRSGPGLPGVLAGFSRLLRQSVLCCLPGALGRSLAAAFRGRPGIEIPAGDRLEMPESYYFNLALKDRKMSPISAWLMERMDFSEVRSRRRLNYSALRKRLAQTSRFEFLFQELPEGVCPLFLPLIVQGARQAARKLQALSIPAVAWWAGYHRAALNWEEFEEARFLKNNLLAIPIHHQLSAGAIEFIGDKIAECVTPA
jgi:dTDP-4-amino-4,6-dideoxygalactose transaminase